MILSLQILSLLISGVIVSLIKMSVRASLSVSM